MGNELFNKIYIYLLLLLGLIFSNESQISSISQYYLNTPTINSSSDIVLNLGLSSLDYSEGNINNSSSSSPNYGHSIGLVWLVSPNLSFDGGYTNFRIENNRNILKSHYNLKLHFNMKGKYINTISITPISKNEIPSLKYRSKSSLKPDQWQQVHPFVAPSQFLGQLIPPVLW